MNTAQEEQAFAPAHPMEAAQTPPYCRPAAPNCKATVEAENVVFPHASLV